MASYFFTLLLSVSLVLSSASVIVPKTKRVNSFSFYDLSSEFSDFTDSEASSQVSTPIFKNYGLQAKSVADRYSHLEEDEAEEAFMESVASGEIDVYKNVFAPSASEEPLHQYSHVSQPNYIPKQLSLPNYAMSMNPFVPFVPGVDAYPAEEKRKVKLSSNTETFLHSNGLVGHEDALRNPSRDF